MMRLFACSLFFVPFAAKRVEIVKHATQTSNLQISDLEDMWLSVRKTRSGSYFAEGMEEYQVTGTSVKVGDEEVASLSEKRGDIQATFYHHIWSVTAAHREEKDCTKWAAYTKMVDAMNKKAAPTQMSSLAERNSSASAESPYECVDWVFVGESTSAPSGMYGLLEVGGNGKRTMHWLKKPPPSEDEIKEQINDIALKLTEELIVMAPTSSDKSLEGVLDWAVGATKMLLSLPEDAVKPSVIDMINKSRYEQGMSAKLKGVRAQKILELVKVLRDVLDIADGGTNEAPF